MGKYVNSTPGEEMTNPGKRRFRIYTRYDLVLGILGLEFA